MLVRSPFSHPLLPWRWIQSIMGKTIKLKTENRNSFVACVNWNFIVPRYNLVFDEWRFTFGAEAKTKPLPIFILFELYKLLSLSSW